MKCPECGATIARRKRTGWIIQDSADLDYWDGAGWTVSKDCAKRFWSNRKPSLRDFIETAVCVPIYEAKP